LIKIWLQHPPAEKAVREANQKRLEELRKKQGSNINYASTEFLKKYQYENVDDKDFKTYSV
jgi:hypothetical protein